VADGAQASVLAPLDTIDGGAIVFAIADSRYALPLASVIMAPPVLCRVPHAPDALLGAGNLGGQVLPVVDLAAFFPGRRSRRYDGGGEVLRVSVTGGAVGFWVDRVEHFAPSGIAIGDAVTVIDPDPLVRLGMTAPSLAPEPTHPLGRCGRTRHPHCIARLGKHIFPGRGCRRTLPAGTRRGAGIRRTPAFDTRCRSAYRVSRQRHRAW
jgi:hypothetical protein